jgi:pimeloyl-ACP methyl ester carboxylesterase
VHLVGLSYGGFIAAMVALKQPQLIRSLTLAEPALFGLLNGVPEAKPALDEWNQAILPMFAALKEGDTVGATKILSGAVNGQPADSFDSQPAALRQVLLDNARTLRPLFAAPPTAVTCEALGAIKVPTLVVRGEHTPGIFLKTNEAAGRCISGSRLAVVPKTAHAMSYQNPQGFNQVVLDFIRRVGS